MKKTVFCLFLCFCLAVGVPTHAALFANGSPYAIYVNRTTNTVTVYTADQNGAYTVPYRVMVCSTGRAGHETPPGIYATTSVKNRWCLMVDGSYGQYSTQFNGQILFHSICYTAPSQDCMMTNEYDLLGSPASLGCVRLQTEDAKWIYDSCPPGTQVLVYDDPDPGPLGRGEKAFDTIPPGQDNGWDPTDPSEQNPWNVIRYLMPTDYHVLIDGNEISALFYKPEKRLVIAAEELEGYGFDISYDPVASTVTVTRDYEKTPTPNFKKRERKRIRARSDLKVILDTGQKKIPLQTVYDTDGEAFIDVEEFADPYGYGWDRQSDTGSVNTFTAAYTEPSPWAKEAVERVIAQEFLPKNRQINYPAPIRRSAAVSLLLRVLGAFYRVREDNALVSAVRERYGIPETECSFSDTTDPDVLTAAKIGLVSGMGNGSFAPKNTLSRAQAAVLLFRAAALCGKQPQEMKNPFHDAPCFADGQIGWCAENGLVSGKEDGSFLPDDPVTLEEMCSLVMRLDSYLQK